MGRTDKKTQFSPYVPIWAKEVVVDIGKQRNVPMGETARDIIMEASRHTITLNKLAPYFWRGLERGEHFWQGHNDRKDITEIIDFPYDKCERLKFRMTIDERREIDDILFALAVSDAHAVAALLILGVHDKTIIKAVAPHFVPHSRFAIERRASKWGYLTRQ